MNENPQSGDEQQVPNGEAHGVSLELLDAKMNIAISKVAVLENDRERTFDKLEELRSGLTDVANGQKAILSTLSNEVLTMNAILKSNIKGPSRTTRMFLSFTGGLAGGVAGGALMTFVWKLAVASNHPVAVSLVNVFR